MVIAGLQKLTLLDFPGYTACTVFTAGCNFACPFCHNADLLAPERAELLSEQEFFDFLKTRRNKLDGVCVTGGEPLLQPDIERFLARIREEGFMVKLDTNGLEYERLKGVIEAGLCDYVAMDIKNVPEKYYLSTGVTGAEQSVKRSVELLKQGKVDYEFRTTVVKQFNEIEDFAAIAKWLSGAKRYFLQQFKDSDTVLESGLSAYSDQQMKEIRALVAENGLDCVSLRGID